QTTPRQRLAALIPSATRIRSIALSGTRLVKQLTSQHPETSWRYEYSPEVFSTTEPEFALDVCNAVTEAWQPTPDSKIIYNLPATDRKSTRLNSSHVQTSYAVF